MSKIIDLTGQKFGRLTLLRFVEKRKSRAFWLCKCDCGNEKIVGVPNLKNGGIKSCGCLRKEKPNGLKHGMRGTRFYNTWRGTKQRCDNKKGTGYNNYGGRGITVCDEWMKFENFRDDMLPSYLEHCEKFGEKNTFIDRIDNNGNYCKENCRWATRKEQNNNQKSNKLLTYKGKTQNLSQWSEELNINYHTLYGRIYNYKWSIKKAFEFPIEK